MADYKWCKVSTGKLFSRTKVCLEYKFVKPMPKGEARIITMFRDSDSKPLGKIEYEYSNGKARITVFAIEDWSTNRYAETLIKEMFGALKKAKVGFVKIELYDTDNKTHDKLTLFKKMGFQIEGGGNTTGYNQYNLVRNL